MKHAIIENWEDRAGEIEAILKPVADVDRVLAYQGQRIDINRYSSLILTGSPLSVTNPRSHELIPWEMSLVEEALKINKPVLGVCFGHQLLAKVLGAEVIKAATPEVGWYPVCFNHYFTKVNGLFKCLPWQLESFHYHFDEVLPNYPLIIIASSLNCDVEAFRYQDAFGIQFHPEISPEKSAEIFNEQGTIESLGKKGIHIESVVKFPLVDNNQKPRDDIFRNFIRFAEAQESR